MRKFPVRPGHPERICWGCGQLCPADDMRCGNGTERGQHPVELWGEDWMRIGHDESQEEPQDAPQDPGPVAGPAETD
jgi:hypothetical protein